ncbi:MAG: hypothetical protein A3J63_03365 [Candidatus Moranbacteria bacterium RIFCSPHIGHO2_02_FULL_40_12b]|nr:MAG: hypothetical protein A3J63_03365 [Candidatus Moranbacteria bacterium RIFCSPHIGHO2_02_FULL_40_12b]OGI23241.1 MAG: hypothetical protein A3E91_02725 [Candidatus Moranbacteria bacterium RIFCSPHIGHO2_12_FULL_40_10]
MKQIESLFLGIIAATGALIAEVFLMIIILAVFGAGKKINLDDFLNITSVKNSISPYLFFFLFAFLEESVKYFFIAHKIEKFSLGRMLIINSLILGLGFSIIEISLIAGSVNKNLISQNYFRQNIAEIFMLHIMTAGLMGYVVVLLNPRKIGTFFAAIIPALFFHLSYNILSQYRNFLINPFIIALFAVLFLINFANLLRINKKLAS